MEISIHSQHPLNPGCSFFFFNWRMIAVQHGCGLCLKATRMSHNSTHISPSSGPRPLPTPLGHHGVPGGPPCAVQQRPAGYLFHTRWCMGVNAPFSVCPSLSSPRPGLQPGLHTCVSISSLSNVCNKSIAPSMAADAGGPFKAPGHASSQTTTSYCSLLGLSGRGSLTTQHL